MEAEIVVKKKTLVPLALVAASIAGGAIGAGLFGTAQAAPNTTSTVTPQATNPPSGKWHSNTNPAHEAGESAARAAEEKKADATGVPPAGFGGHSNTDPAHEAGESAARAAEERARDAGQTASPSGTGTAG
jgi:hypothetical protein